MTKELLEQYPYICAEIQEIKADKSTDVVSESLTQPDLSKSRAV